MGGAAVRPFPSSPRTMSISIGAIMSAYYFGAYLGFIDPSSASYTTLVMPGSSSVPLVGTFVFQTAPNGLSMDRM